MKSTVFILGAGSSIPFGYPSGLKLIEIILDSLNINYFYKFEYSAKDPATWTVYKHAMKQNFTDFELYLLNGFTNEEIMEFGTALLHSNKDSIDSFLFERKEFQEIGKFAIANAILKYENPNEFQYVNQNWLKYLWNKINLSKSNFDQSIISFITFNYDRVLEQFFYNSLKYSFKIDDKEIRKSMSHKPIIHLHGVVGLLPWQDKEQGFEYFYSGQDKQSQNDRINKARKNIKIIYEQTADRDKEFSQAMHLLLGANEVFALGFGFNPLNLERLRINGVTRPIVCSAYGLTQHECQIIEQQYPDKLILDKNGYDNLDFLRNYLIDL